MMLFMCSQVKFLHTHVFNKSDHFIYPRILPGCILAIPYLEYKPRLLLNTCSFEAVSLKEEILSLRISFLLLPFISALSSFPFAYWSAPKEGENTRS